MDGAGPARAPRRRAGGLLRPRQLPGRRPRGFTYSFAYIGLRRLGARQFYLISIKDKDGNAFDGGKTYRLTVPVNPPVEQYWSATVYDRANHALVRNLPRASRSSTDPRDAEERRRLGRTLLRPCGAGRQGVELGADEARRRDLRLCSAVYAPTKAFFDKTWKLPDIEKVAAQ